MEEAAQRHLRLAVPEGAVGDTALGESCSGGEAAGADDGGGGVLAAADG